MRAAIGVLLLLFALCIDAGAEAATEADQTLTFSFWGAYKDLECWKELTGRFEAAHPGVRIVLQFTPTEYGEKLQLRLISNSAADLILMDDETYPSYAARGYLEDLQPYIERDRATLPLDGFLPTAMKAFTYEFPREPGRRIVGGLPWDGMPVLMFYNKDLFTAAGISFPAGDWTWDDFRRIAKALTRDTNGDGRLDQFGASLGFGWLDIEPLVWSFGGRFLSEDNSRSAVKDTPYVLEAARFMQEIKFQDRCLAYFAEQQGQTKEVQILTGRIGMMASGWFVAQALNDIKADMRWGVCAMPRGPRGDRFTRVSYDGISINAAAAPRRKELAWQFIRYLVSEDAQRYIAESGRGIPVVIEYAQKYFVNPDTEADEHLAIDAMMDSSYGRLTPITPRYLGLRRMIDATWSRIEREDMSLRWTPEQMIDVLDQRINEEIAKELAMFGPDHEKPVPRSPTPFRYGAAILAVAAAFLLVRLGRRTGSPLHDLRVMAVNRGRRTEALWGLLFASPWMIGFLIFLAFPIVFSLVLSFNTWDPYDPVSERVFVGFDNYVRAMTKDPLVWIALRKTFTYAAVTVPLMLAGALALAMLLNRNVRGIGVFRTLFYIPNVVGGVATAIMWVFIFNPVYGPLNGFLARLNDTLDKTPLAFITLPEPNWLNDPTWAMPAMIIMMLWGLGGGAMIIFLAGLQGIPQHLYEAAELDGAGRLRQFWNVTLPMLSPTIFFNLIMGIIASLQVFMQAYVLQGKDGGTEHQLLFFVLYLYKKAFLDYEFGYAAALAWILFAVIMAFTLLILRSSAVWVYYEGERR